MENLNHENVRARRRKAKNRKTVALILAMLMLVGCVAGGTLAWLTAKSTEVTNVFTTSDINITLTETKGTENGANREFKMIPGWTIEKDPKVKVVAGSEDCYLFVKIEKENNFDHFMTYGIAEGWTELTDVEGVSGVYYRVIDSDAKKNIEYSILSGDKVIVKDSVSKTDMNNLTADTLPTLKFTAYAVQYQNGNTTTFEPKDAWAEAVK